LIKHGKIFFLTLCFLFIISFCSSQNPGSIPEKELRVEIIGDTQHIGFWESLYWGFWGEHNIEKTKKLLREIADRNPAFVINLGDLTADGSSETQWKYFDEDNKPIFDKHIPYYAIFGNHEYFGNEIKSYINFYLRFPQLKGKKWYSINIQNTGFIMLNSNFDALSVKDSKEQLDWYISELNKMENDGKVKFICVLSHHPPYTNSTIVNPSDEIRNLYVSPFTKSQKAALFFSGHCHSYEKFTDSGKYFIVSGGGGGPRQKLNTNKSSRKYIDLFEGPEIRFFHFCELEINHNSMHVKVVRLNDNGSFDIADEIDINRP
jgi:3',5'-cyclic AMP phosphodiesterase CpdA